MDVREMAEPVIQEMLAASAVLPEQFDACVRRYACGERALMWAVFADGIDCYRRNAHASSVQRRVEFQEAEHWVWSTDWDWPFSFVNLCEAFGFDAARLRQALECGRERHRAFRRQRFRHGVLRAA